MVQKGAGLEGVEPPLAVVNVFLGEDHLDQPAVLLALVSEVLGVLLQVREVLLGLLGGGGTQTLVVLNLPTPQDENQERERETETLAAGRGMA